MLEKKSFFFSSYDLTSCGRLAVGLFKVQPHETRRGKVLRVAGVGRARLVVRETEPGDDKVVDLEGVDALPLEEELVRVQGPWNRIG